MKDFAPGDIIDARYLLETLVGVGGFAEVWKATDNLLARTVAIKILLQQFKKREDIIEDFKREFTAFQDFRHPNLINARHFGMHGDLPYLTLEYSEAGSLDRLRDAKRRQGGAPNSGGYSFFFSEQEVVTMLSDAAKGLTFLHDRDIMHGDIKPANILLSGNGSYALTDFGISQQTRFKISKAASTNMPNPMKGTSNVANADNKPSPSSPQSGKKQQDPKGTAAYLAPELFTDNPSKSTLSDIFSLGVTAYEMVTNDVPWAGEGGAKLLDGAGGQVPDLWKVTAEARLQNKYTISEQLCNLITACMNPDPKRRPRAIDLQYRLLQLFPQYLQPAGMKSDNSSFPANGDERFQAKMTTAKRLLAEGRYRMARNMYHSALATVPMNTEALRGWDQSNKLYASRLAFWISAGIAGTVAGLVVLKLIFHVF